LLLLLRAPTPPRPLYFWGGNYQKIKSPVASGLALGYVCDGVGVVEVVSIRVQSVLMGYLSLRESDPRPKGPGPGFSDFIFSYFTFGTFG
jgi:hypothetical protein